VVLLRLSPSECFEQDEVVLYKLRLLLDSRDRECRWRNNLTFGILSSSLLSGETGCVYAAKGMS
jgi:hypothetical protein